MVYLTVTAHPDDEILGFGGSTFTLSQQGHIVFNLILSGEVDARKNKPIFNELQSNVFSAQRIVGAQDSFFGSFPNIKFNTVPHLDIVKFIENYLEILCPDVVLTHHPNDLNNDHFHVSIACQAAVRIFQRNQKMSIKGFYFMEIPSSTDWSFSFGGQQFKPDTFIEINQLGLEKKLEALHAYEGIMRPYPHPRSIEVISSLAVIRGSQVGRNLCEGFQTVLNVIE